jgi:hypothetical protein
LGDRSGRKILHDGRICFSAGGADGLLVALQLSPFAFADIMSLSE